MLCYEDAKKIWVFITDEYVFKSQLLPLEDTYIISHVNILLDEIHSVWNIHAYIGEYLIHMYVPAGNYMFRAIQKGSLRSNNLTCELI